MSDAKEAAERMLAEDSERLADRRQSYKTDDGASMLDICRAYLTLVADPCSQLKEPVWEEIDHGAEFGWQSPIGGYYANLRHSGEWRACIYAGAMSEIKMCESADAAKLACWEHYRGVMRGAMR